MATDTPSTTSPFNRTAQHDAKRAAILSQAARLFNTKGSRATTLQDIAASLGLTKTSLYYYVKTKEELIYQCYMAALDHHHRRLDALDQQPLSPLERTLAVIKQPFADWQAAREGKAPHIAALMEIASLKGEQREQVEARYVQLFLRVRQYLREGIDDGSLRPCEPTATTRAILGSVEWTFYWLHDIPLHEVPAAAEQAADILGRGLYGGEGDYCSTAPPPTDVYDGQLHGFDREEQNRRKQEAFYKTGTWFFNKQGFNGTSLEDIAEHLNVSKGAFYYHIRNKEDLLFNCYSRSLDITESIHRQSAKLSGSGLQKLDQSCRGIFQAQNSDSGPLIRYNTITALPTERRREILRRTEAVNDRFGDFIRAGIDDGSVRHINSYVAENLLAGALNAAMDIKIWRGVENLDATATDYFDVFFNGLLPRH